MLFVVGAILAGVGLGWGIFACRQRRRKRLSAQSSLSAGAKSKEISPPPTSRSLAAIPSTGFSQSIPSYPSSKYSDFGKASTYFGAQVFDYAELEEATGNFDRSRELGDGGFGTVYYGKTPLFVFVRLHKNASMIETAKIINCVYFLKIVHNVLAKNTTSILHEAILTTFLMELLRGCMYIFLKFLC